MSEEQIQEQLMEDGHLDEKIAKALTTIESALRQQGLVITDEPLDKDVNIYSHSINLAEKTDPLIVTEELKQAISLCEGLIVYLKIKVNITESEFLSSSFKK